MWYPNTDHLRIFADFKKVQAQLTLVMLRVDKLEFRPPKYLDLKLLSAQSD